MAQPTTISRCQTICRGAGRTITTPPGRPPCGPGLAREATTQVGGMAPASHAAAANPPQRVSWGNTT
eukprot:6592358-Lingulodinium_polyedra.AAC.1